jgi:hypothetical protein
MSKWDKTVDIWEEFDLEKENTDEMVDQSVAIKENDGNFEKIEEK